MPSNARSWFSVMFIIGYFYHLGPEKSIFIFQAEAVASRTVVAVALRRRLKDTLEETT